MKTKNAFCKSCDDDTKHVRADVAHGGHGIATLLTGGLWALVWGSRAYHAQWEWSCDECGEAAPVPAFRRTRKAGADLLGFARWCVVMPLKILAALVAILAAIWILGSLAGALNLALA